MQVYGMKIHLLFCQFVTIVLSYPPRKLTIGPSGFEIVTRPPFIPDVYYNYQLYNDGRLEKPDMSLNITQSEQDVVTINRAVVENHEPLKTVKLKLRAKPKLKEVHFKDGVSSMIMDIKMPPHYHSRNDKNDLYNFDVKEIARQLSSFVTAATLPQKLFSIKVHQKSDNENKNRNQVQDLATFFSSGRDLVDYGYSLENSGNTGIEEELTALSRLYKGDLMNNIVTSTDMSADTPSTEESKILYNTEPTEIFKFNTDADVTDFYTTTESYSTAEEDDFLRGGHLPANVIASLVGR